MTTSTTCPTTASCARTRPPPNYKWYTTPLRGPPSTIVSTLGPTFGQSIFDILVRFRPHRVVVAGDTERAFLMLSMNVEDRGALRFLWVRDVEEESPELVTYRFTCVAFGVSSSPFLLNATIQHHMKKFIPTDPEFVHKFLC